MADATSSGYSSVGKWPHRATSTKRPLGIAAAIFSPSPAGENLSFTPHSISRGHATSGRLTNL